MSVVAPEKERVLTPVEIRRKIRELAESEGISLTDQEVEEIAANSTGTLGDLLAFVQSICRRKQTALLGF